MLLKEFVEYFVPYGFLVLMRGINRFRKGLPFLEIKYKKIERNVEEDCLYNISVKKLAGENDIVQIQREDYSHPVFIRNLTSDAWAYRTVIEREEYNFIVKESPKYIIDAGANIGMASLYFSNKYKEAIIIAIEPEENNYNLLKRNTEGYSNIVTIKAALWNKSEEIQLYETGLGNVGFMVETNDAVLRPAIHKIKHCTKTITVDEIIKKYNIDIIDILKIDIEGSEKEVFESCESWIFKTKCMIIELHERMKRGCNKAFYRNVKMFDQIGKCGENIYLSRENYIQMKK